LTRIGLQRPLPRAGKYRHAPLSIAEYRKLGTRKVTLHPVTITPTRQSVSRLPDPNGAKTAIPCLLIASSSDTVVP